MPKKPPNIKWRDIDLINIEKERKSYNQKIYYRRSKYPEERAFLPDTIKKVDIKKEIETRKDYNKFIKNIGKISSSDKIVLTSEYGAKTTKRELSDLQEKVEKINNERKMLKDKYLNQQVTLRGEKIGLTRGEMGDERTKYLNPLNFNFAKMNKRDFEAKKATIKRLSSPSYRIKRQREYKANYIKALRMNGVDERIINKLMKRPAVEFDNLYRTEELATIDFLYQTNDNLEQLEIELLTSWNLKIKLNYE